MSCEALVKVVPTGQPVQVVFEQVLDIFEFAIGAICRPRLSTFRWDLS